MGGVWLIVNLVALSLVAGSSMGKSAPPRKKVVIEGAVYCTYCVLEWAGAPGTAQYTVPLPGAVVKLRCNNRKKGSWEEEMKTDDMGGFVLRPEKVSSRGAHKCKISVVSSPRSDCPTTIAAFSSGVVLRPARRNATSPFQLYTVQTLVYYPAPNACF